MSVFQKVKFFEFFWRRNSLVFMLKRRVQFFESYWKKSFSHIEKKFSSLYRIFEKSSILWVVFFYKNSKIQFFGSHSKKKSILWVMLKKFQFFESFFQKKKGSVLLVMLRRFISLVHVQKGSILWVIQEKMFHSLSHFLGEKSSIFWVFFCLKKVSH